ncbi:hypothetical protein N0V88_007556 [Collariella sp. IMI 366227]|nr:hypothetical protein N0V88_007556 [Collariella sp. IMI 366227]
MDHKKVELAKRRMSDSGQFRVVISGAGVAGLTLANALEQAGVDYVLLERYWVTWGERQNLLRVLYKNLKDPSKVLVNKDLVDIKHSPDGITAICADGSTYQGDILIGADGVFSKTRAKMWELAEPDLPDLIKADKNCLIADYNCLFGIAHNLSSPLLTPGDVHTGYNSQRCLLTVVAEHGKVFYFAQERLDKTYRLSSIPRYTAADAQAFIARNSDLIMLPDGPRGGGITLADLWDKTVTSRLVAIEEGKFQVWHWGRIGCVGDAVHKSTPNLGIGGNGAVESAAVLANEIKKLVNVWKETGKRPDREEVEGMLGEYQRLRRARAEAVVDASGMYARLQNLHGMASKVFVRYALPQLREFVPELMGDAMIGAAKLDYLPLPMVSLTGAMPFNPTQGEGLHESKVKRLLFALPLLGMVVAAGWVMNVSVAVEWARAVREGGSIEVDGEVVPVLHHFYQNRGFDDFLATVNAFFFPSVYGTDPDSRRQVISFLTDCTILLTIWILESARRANMLTPLQWPALFAIFGQLFGLGIIVPCYCLLHYTLSPISKFASLDSRLTDIRITDSDMKTFATLLATVGLVAAHGYVDNATIGGQFYQPYMDPYMGDNKPARISRSIPGNGPVEDATSLDVQCNAGSVPAKLHATAAAGSDVTLRWTLWPDSHVGPLITYMARCPDTGCQDWSPGTSPVWFKIKEAGREGTSNTWATPGFYLVRHEIIALHAAWAYPGAQFYPGCHQLNVTGGGSTVPGNLVAFPGAYKGTDAGITYDAYKGE